jgi:superfamily II DNA or RNA helicase
MKSSRSGIPTGDSNSHIETKVANLLQKGIYLSLNPETIYKLGEAAINRITEATSIWVTEPAENPNSPPIPVEIKLWSMEEGSLKFPSACLDRIKLKGWEWDIKEDPETKLRLCLDPIKRFPITLDPHQLEILQEVRECNRSGLIEAAMGAGKSWILLALVLGNRLLRPAAISGKGQKDTKQLLEKLSKLFEENPEFREPIMLSGLGRSLSKKDRAILEQDEGIIVCTHAGLQNLPENTRLLVLDEAHAASTPKRVSKVTKLPNLKRVYGLTGTAGLRGDGGDELLESLIGKKIISKGHEHFESTGRVAPAQINAYHFNGRGIYSENPYRPSETPQEGYSLHSTWVENHRGRHEFVADLILSLPHNETKVIFVPHIVHAVRLCKAIEKKVQEKSGDLNISEKENYKPIIFHAKADKKDRYFMSKEERDSRVSMLEKGIVKVAVSTDFLSTGFDTNMIDHIIDASGKKAIIVNIQRSGRGIRPRTKEDGSIKINQIHTILDKTHPILHKLGEKKFSALCAYYNHKEGFANPEREGGVSRFVDPPWIAPQDRDLKLGSTQDSYRSAATQSQSQSQSSGESLAHLRKPEQSSFNPWTHRKKT